MAINKLARRARARQSLSKRQPLSWSFPLGLETPAFLLWLVSCGREGGCSRVLPLLSQINNKLRSQAKSLDSSFFVYLKGPSS